MVRKRLIKYLAIPCVLALCVGVPTAVAALGNGSGTPGETLSLGEGGSVQVNCPPDDVITPNRASPQAFNLYCNLAPTTTTTSTTVATSTTTSDSAPPTSTATTTTVASPPTTTGTTTATTTGTQTTGTSTNPDPFSASWDQPLGATTTVSDSATMVQNFISGYQQAYGSVGINAGDVGLPLVTVPADQADVPITVNAGCSNFTAGGVGATGTEVPIPPGSAVSETGDHPLVVWQPSTDTEWEFWQIEASGAGYSACWGGELTDVSTSNGVFPAPYGFSATGISYLGTMITDADVAAGVIDHTMAILVPFCNGSVFPADRGDCGSDPGNVSEGSWLRIPPGTPEPAGLTPIGQMIFTALENYGAIVTDYAGAYVFDAQFSATSNDIIQRSFGGEPEYEALDGIPWNSLQVINPPPTA